LSSLLEKNINDLTPFEKKIVTFLAPDVLFYSLQYMNKFEKMQRKGLSDLYKIATKEMTAEEFVESEHPRGADGEFVKKNEAGAPAGPHPTKGAWGGARKNAGRMTNDPVAAKEKLVAQWKEENPKITEEETRQKLIDYALEKQNPDLYLLASDPAAYQKKREQEVMDAIASRPGKVKVNGKTIPRVSDSEGTEKVFSEVKTSRAKWDREVQQSRDVKEAYDTFMKDHPDESERSKAKLITAAATIAMIVGVGALIASRPKIAGKKLIAEEEKFYRTPGASTEARILTEEGEVNPLEVDPTWLQFTKILPESEFKGITGARRAYLEHQGYTFARALGPIRRLLAKATGKVRHENGIPVTEFRDLGPMLSGDIKHSPEWDLISTKHNYHEVQANFDTDPHTGLTLFHKIRKIGADGKLSREAVQSVDYTNLAIVDGRLPMNPADLGSEKWPFTREQVSKWGFEVFKGEGGVEHWGIKGTSKTTSGLVKEASEEVAEVNEYWENKAKQWLAKSKWELGSEGEKRVVKLNPILSMTGEKGKPKQFQVRVWPSELMRKRKAGQIAQHKKAADNLKTYHQWASEKVLPQLSGRTLAALTATAGAGALGETVYYFQSDIERFLGNYKKFREEQDTFELPKEPGKKGNSEVELQKAKNRSIELEIKREKETQKRDAVKFAVDAQREQYAKKLVELGIRRNLEGVNRTYAFKPETTFARMDALGWLDSDEKKAEVLKVLKGDDVEKKIDLLERIDALYEKLEAEGAFKGTGKKTGTNKGASLADLIDKAFGVKGYDANKPQMTQEEFEDEVITQAAMELAKMISDISQSCKTVVEGKMPGSSGFTSLNNIVTEIYAFMKDSVKHNEANGVANA